MDFEYSKLIGKIHEKCGSQAVFALGMKRSERTVSLKLNNKKDWKQSEMALACEILGIKITEIPEYFFKIKVQNT